MCSSHGPGSWDSARVVVAEIDGEMDGQPNGQVADQVFLFSFFSVFAIFSTLIIVVLHENLISFLPPSHTQDCNLGLLVWTQLSPHV